MTGFRNMMLGAAGAAGGGYSVDNSIVMDDGGSQYLTRTPSAAGNLKTFTVSFWFKRGNLGILTYLLKRRTAGFGFIRINADDTLTYYNEAGGVAIQLITTQVFRDPHSWYHLVVVQDTTQATASDRAKMYLNGSEITAFNTAQYNIAQNGNGTLFDADTLDIGQSSTQFWDGYLSEYCYIDGAALTETSFGEYDTNGVWRPVDVSGLTFGTNGFYLPFSTGSGANLGANSVSASTFTPAAANYTYNATYLTIGSGTINNNGSPGVSGRLNNPFNGDFTFSFTATAIAGSIFGVFDATELSTFATGTDDGGLDSMTNSWWYDDGGNGTGGGGTVGNGYFMYGNSSQGTGPIAAGSAVTIERTGSTIKITDDSSDAHSFSQTFSGPVYIMIGHRNITSKSMDYDSVSMNGIEAFAVTGSPTQSDDSPTKNFCVLTPLEYGGNGGVATFSEGNLKVVQSNGSALNTFGSIGLSSGKWHYEVTLTNTVDQFGLGIIPVGNVTGNTNQFFNLGIGAMISGSSDGNVYNNGSSVATITGGSGADGQTLSCEIDLDNDQLEWFNNAGSSLGTYSFTPTTANGGRYLPCVHCNDNATYVVNFGASTFSKTPSTGFTGISAALLNAASAPAIADGTAHHQTTIWEGSSSISVPRLISQSGNSTFKPDWVWGKNRDNGGYSFRYFDSVRGETKVLQTGGSSYTDAEATDANGVTDFEANGFDIGNGVHLNGNNESIVAWQWAAGGEPTTDNIAGAGATPTAGSVKIDGSNLGSSLGGTIPVTRLSANRTSGFSIGTYTGSGSNGTIATGLTTKPDMLIIKKRGDDGGNNWVTYHSGLANQGTGYVDLGTNAVEGTLANMFNSVAPGSSDATLFNVGTNTSTNDTGGTDTYVFYCFHEVPGYSKFGTYDGNNSTNGPFIEMGFSPSWVMFKRISGTVSSWAIYDNNRDPYNVADTMLLPDSTAGDNVGNEIDWLSNGVKIRGTSAAYNASNTYIYAAFAEHPFAGSTPATAR